PPRRRHVRPIRCRALPSRTGPRRRRPARADPETGRSTPVRASSWHASRLFLGDPPWTVSRIVSHAGGRLQLPVGKGSPAGPGHRFGENLDGGCFRASFVGGVTTSAHVGCDFPRAGKRARLGVMLTRHTHILSAPGKGDSHGSRHADGV